MILDTNCLSAVIEGESALQPLLSQALRVSIPVITLGEYRYGISLSRDRLRYEQWLSEYLPGFEILDINELTTLAYSAVRVDLKKAGRPIPSNDMWIAALCRQYSLPLLSRDKHFDAVPGLTRISW